MHGQNKLSHRFAERVEERLQTLYPELPPAPLLQRIISLVDEHRRRFPPGGQERWNQEDAILITYGGSIRDAGEAPLRTLGRFLNQQLTGTVNSIHILPFFPYSSDDGFAVIDYREVDDDLGDWDDVNRISRDFNLMVDLVINHCSRENLWFVDFLNDTPPGCDYFIEMPAATDVHTVIRPRTSPLLVPVHTRSGKKHVWATFGKDQIDLNFRNPELLLEFIAIFLLYISRGARFIRLDAIAFLWKKPGTRCVHLRQTHEVVKLLRDIIDAAAPHCVLITETNVPNGENISYFGNSDEAHMVYRFTLPPLLLHALYRGDASQLTRWGMDHPRPPRNCTYLNFTASHDGIGLRPLEGILSEQEVNQLVASMREFGGYVTMKSNPSGVDTPYEINITYFDAMKGTHMGIDRFQVPRFICAQTVMLSLQGIPALYLHSLTATANDYAGVEQSGRTRSINRHVWDLETLWRQLQIPGSPNRLVFDELRRRLRTRRLQTAFHPESDQRTIDLGDPFFALWRRNRQQRILAVNNMTDQIQHLPLPPHPSAKESAVWHDLLSDSSYPAAETSIPMQPYQSLWLEVSR